MKEGVDNRAPRPWQGQARSAEGLEVVMSAFPCRTDKAHASGNLEHDNASGAVMVNENALWSSYLVGRIRVGLV
jgi:hypothetical protein